jgi:hypothetical protein
MPGVYSLKEGYELDELSGSLEAYGIKPITKSGPMTIREFAQFFGTEIGRKTWSPVWINYLINKVKKEKSELAIITDVRFPNEVESIKEAGGIIIKLNRKIKSKDKHPSETEVDNVPQELIDYLINNNKKGYTLNDLQVDVKKIYDHIIL